MVITGGEGSEALVTEYSGIAAVSEEGGVGTPTKEVTLTSIIEKQISGFVWFFLYSCLYVCLKVEDSVKIRQLPSLRTPRYSHACGTYTGLSHMQHLASDLKSFWETFFLGPKGRVLLVVGGRRGSSALASTELFDYPGILGSNYCLNS